jgi:leucyl/phenylalanyl-tRNA--protein transferase
LKTFGAVEIPRRRYTALLDKALSRPAADFERLPLDRPISGAEALATIAGRR